MFLDRCLLPDTSRSSVTAGRCWHGQTLHSCSIAFARRECEARGSRPSAALHQLGMGMVDRRDPADTRSPSPPATVSSTNFHSTPVALGKFACRCKRHFRHCRNTPQSKHLKIPGFDFTSALSASFLLSPETLSPSS
ncbi:unnamed protein product [Mycena citricolor]|uniref:Uncharacterized protein n=1 Tax=Mycena citricolor TaxID=2018698 RepID=A0AAD2HKJ1_9AGAR|nr:unnamed protein product [Mycena citricolor]